jgi:formate hydrogenlyase transcriptional activator
LRHREQWALAIENLLAYEEIAALKARSRRRTVYLQEEVRSEAAFGDVVGESPHLGVLDNVRKVAGTESTVLVTGETGTGKELIVRAIHGLSRRKHKILVKVNCAPSRPASSRASSSDTRRGRSPGAHAQGRSVRAGQRGHALPRRGRRPSLELQAKLLRVLQEGEFERVGGPQTLKVDVRIVAATNRDLEHAVQEERFRADLFYRLNVFPIAVPPLRKRPEDIPRLARHFATFFSKKMGRARRRLSGRRAAEADRRNAWPGTYGAAERHRAGVILSPPGRFVLGDVLVDR